MPWLDPARLNESAEDRELREELRGLMGAPPAHFFEAEVTPAIIAMAEDLRREAERRQYTSRHQPNWMLMAAALPIALVLAGLGTWGYQQKTRADFLAQDLAQRDQEHRAQLIAVSDQLKTEREARDEFVRTIQKEGPKSIRRLGKELVIPVDRSPISSPANTQQVKAQ